MSVYVLSWIVANLGNVLLFLLYQDGYFDVSWRLETGINLHLFEFNKNYTLFVVSVFIHENYLRFYYFFPEHRPIRQTAVGFLL